MQTRQIPIKLGKVTVCCGNNQCACLNGAANRSQSQTSHIACDMNATHLHVRCLIQWIESHTHTLPQYFQNSSQDSFFIRDNKNSDATFSSYIRNTLFVASVCLAVLATSNALFNITVTNATHIHVCSLDFILFLSYLSDVDRFQNFLLKIFFFHLYSSTCMHKFS